MTDRSGRAEPTLAATCDDPDGGELFRALSESGIPEAGLCRAGSAADILAPVLQDLLCLSEEMLPPRENERSVRPSSCADHGFDRGRP